MHSSRMRTARSLTVSRRIPRTHIPPTMHAPRNHTHPPPATMHTPWQPCIHPWQPCMPLSNHTPPGNHTYPPATMHAPPLQPCIPPWQPCMPPSNHTPPATMHPPVDRITDAYENITLPQLRCGR